MAGRVGPVDQVQRFQPRGFLALHVQGGVQHVEEHDAAGWRIRAEPVGGGGELGVHRADGDGGGTAAGGAADELRQTRRNRPTRHRRAGAANRVARRDPRAVPDLHRPRSNRGPARPPTPFPPLRRCAGGDSQGCPVASMAAQPLVIARCPVTSDPVLERDLVGAGGRWQADARRSPRRSPAAAGGSAGLLQRAQAVRRLAHRLKPAGRVRRARRAGCHRRRRATGHARPSSAGPDPAASASWCRLTGPRSVQATADRSGRAPYIAASQAPTGASKMARRRRAAAATVFHRRS